MKKLSYILLCGLMLILSACEKDIESSNFAPVVTTGTASNIYRMGATLSGSTTLTETNTAKEYGILFSELESMAEYDEYPVKDGSTSYSVLIQNLEPGETYYYCAYASSGYSIAKSQIKSFTTTQSNAPVFNEVILQSKDEKSCAVSTELLDDGGSELLMTGFVWTEVGSGDPTIKSNVVNVEPQGSRMSATIKGMEPNKTYLVRAYAVNAQGVGYSNSISVTTNTATVPFLSNITRVDSTEVSITLKASVVDAGLGNVTKFGFCYSSESKNPTTDHLVAENIQGNTEEFSALIENLNPETTYYFRAYAENEKGVGYSNVIEYTTQQVLVQGSEGDVYVAEAGGLSKFIDDSNKYNITKLKVSGYLNGDDIRLIREMAGRDVNGNETAGRLVDLDISGATIVQGGGAYYGAVATTSNGDIGGYMFHSTILKNILLPKNVTSIGDYAFYGCSSLASINIPDGVTSIGYLAFCNCSSLESVTIPDAVTTLKLSTFFQCTSLVDVNLPNGLISIDEQAFYGCTSLKNITIPEGVTTIGVSAFSGCSSLTSVIIPDKITLLDRVFVDCSSLAAVSFGDGVTTLVATFVNCSALTDITLPKSVVTIESAFQGCTSLTTITIPEGVTTIGAATFYGCSSLEDVIIPESVTLIDEVAFWECASLAKISLPESLTQIGKQAFCLCRSLSEITIPKNVTSIETSAFLDCASLSEVTCNATTPPALGSTAFDGIASTSTLHVPSGTYSAYNSSDWAQYFGKIDDGESHGSYANGVAIIDKAGTLVSFIPEEEKYTITSLKVVGPLNGDDIRYIREMAGRDVNNNETVGRLVDLDISEATIVEGGDSYRSGYYTNNGIIGRFMFYKTNIENIVLPDVVTEIGDYAFSSCSSLTSIDIPDDVTSIGSSAFSDCSSLTSINIPNGVTSIDGVFSGCSSLASVTIPESVTSIGDNAFSYCSSLTSIVIPDAVTSLGKSAFEDCKALTSIDIPDAVTSLGKSAFEGCNALASINIPNGVTSIAERTFKDCSSLTSIDIPNGVTSIDAQVFSGCNALALINIPDGVTSIGESAFAYCSVLKSVAFPDGVTEISQTVFFDCSQLTDFTIPEGVTKIGSGAFQNCSNLSNIIIPNTVIFIDSSAFSYCSLTSIDIPDSVTRIGNSVFEYCSLQEVTIGSGLTELGNWAFYYGFAGDKFTIKATTPPTIKGSEMFNYAGTGVKLDPKTLYVPTGCATAYSESKWAQFFENIIEM